MEGIEQRLDAKAVASREQSTVICIPEDEGEFTTQLMETLRSEVLVEVKRDLAIRAGAQAMSRPFQAPLRGLIAVELAVDDDLTAAIFTRDGLRAGGEIDDAEPRMSETHPSVGRDPVLLTIWAARLVLA